MFDGVLRIPLYDSVRGLFWLENRFVKKYSCGKQNRLNPLLRAKENKTPITANKKDPGMTIHRDLEQEGQTTARQLLKLSPSLWLLYYSKHTLPNYTFPQNIPAVIPRKRPHSNPSFPQSA